MGIGILGSRQLLGERDSALSLTLAEKYGFSYQAWGDSFIFNGKGKGESVGGAVRIGER